MMAKMVPTKPDSADYQADTAGAGALYIDAFDDSTTTLSTLTSVSLTSTYSRASGTQNRSSDDAILADLAGSREQLIYLQRKLLGRIKNAPEPNERDAFMDLVSMPWQALIRLFGAKSRLTYTNWSAAKLTCRSSSNNSCSLDLTFPQTRIVIPVPWQPYPSQ
ncbi:hypothetical protein DPMN_071942 [Dreissena polymorpha]|uniref:Uncharacterized protein n=1 Tax=Dreissena polymorpha TaxID=45954 RepID=A0A9D3Z5G0_DREPO|nr:hypothetical protein DPMN_071942 [Dreissena polymorpha]